MDKQAAIRIIKDTFEDPFDRGRFVDFIRNLFNSLDGSKAFVYQGNYVPDSFKPYISTLERVGKFNDKDGNTIDVLIACLKKEQSLERARTMQRNFIAWYLNGSRGELKDAALVAFVAPDEEDWRFSLVKMEYTLEQSGDGKTKVKKELTPARRWSFIVGKNESSHTAQRQLLPILEDDRNNPSLADLEKAFSIEVVTREFFEKYHELFVAVKEALDNHVEHDAAIRKDFVAKAVSTVDFSKKLLGQIVFLYFLQKKGWFGVGRDEAWGTGPRNFLRLLFDKKVASYKNFFNDILEPLFYEALAKERDGDFYSRFNCKIPFLNGGLFDPINNYDWVHVDILLPNELFSNSEKTKEGDTGTGILDVFDRYNFTVKEDEPLEKEVAVDPEMLGKVFENLLEVKDRKSKGTYYTPREIVHYMCQESLINYLDTAINTGEVALARTNVPQGKLFGEPDPQQMALATQGYKVRIPREDIAEFIHRGEFAVENDAAKIAGTGHYKYQLPRSIRDNAELLDDKLADLKVCDPAIGSGAFPVGMMHEIVKARNILTTYLGEKSNRTTYDFKRHCIQNCLYGVDIDPGAVEIAKLRLWLSLVVDEEEIRQIKPLPNLDYKIVCGNSLAGLQPRLENWQVFDELERLKPLYFDETNSKRKHEIKERIEQLIRQAAGNSQDFYFHLYFSEVFREKRLERPWRAYHVTWVTHNSRVSERMTEFRVKTGEPVFMSEEWQTRVTQEITSVVSEDGLKVLAYNILPDHMHIVLVCEEHLLTNIVRKLKGRSSQKLKDYLGIPQDEQFHLWAQKFNCSYIDTEEKLRNTLQYVTYNREKHGHAPLNKGLQPLVQSDTLQPLVQDNIARMLTPVEEAFVPAVHHGGFDIVIANPPYVRQEQIKELKPTLQQYFTCYTGVADLYVYFYERGFQILKEGGTLTYISSNKYFRSGYGEKLRRFLGQKSTVVHLIDFGDAPVFEAIAYPSIILLRKSPPDGNETRVLPWKPGPPIEEFDSVFRKSSFLIMQKELMPDGWRLESPAVLRLLEKLRRAGKPLGEFVNGRFYRGVLTGLNEAFVVDRATRDRLIAEHSSSAEILKPFLRGRDVKRWRVEPKDLWLIFTRHGVDIKKYPAIQEHLRKYKNELTPGIKGGRKPGSYQWYEIQDNIAYWREFEQPKIVYPDIAQGPEFAFDSNGHFLSNTLYLLPTDETWLLGLLNSKAVSWFYERTSSQIRGGFVRFIAQYVSQIPVPIAHDTTAIGALVARIVTAEHTNPDADVSDLESEIDQLVYQLYGLTKEEIAIIEGQL